MRYCIDLVSGKKRYIEADRYTTLSGGIVVFEKENKTTTGSTIVLPESMKDQKYEVVLVLSCAGFATFEPMPDA